jgi:hypothetical protein
MKSVIALALSLVALLTPTLAVAHPHLWVQQVVRAVAKDGRYTHVEIEWRFDPFSSEIEIPLIDENKDGKFSTREIKALEGDMMPELKNYGFLTWLNAGALAGLQRAHRRSGELHLARLGPLGRRQVRHADAREQARQPADRAASHRTAQPGLRHALRVAAAHQALLDHDLRS